MATSAELQASLDAITSELETAANQLASEIADLAAKANAGATVDFSRAQQLADGLRDLAAANAPAPPVNPPSA